MPAPFIPVVQPSLPSSQDATSGGFSGGGGLAVVDDSGLMSTTDNPFQLSTDDQGRCTSNNLEACGCDSTGPEAGLDVCYQRFATTR